MYQVLRVHDQHVSDIRAYPTGTRRRWKQVSRLTRRQSWDARHVTPILNVSSLERSFDWFARLGLEQELGLALR